MRESFCICRRTAEWPHPMVSTVNENALCLLPYLYTINTINRIYIMIYEWDPGIQPRTRQRATISGYNRQSLSKSELDKGVHVGRSRAIHEMQFPAF